MLDLIDTMLRLLAFTLMGRYVYTLLHSLAAGTYINTYVLEQCGVSWDRPNQADLWAFWWCTYNVDVRHIQMYISSTVCRKRAHHCYITSHELQMYIGTTIWASWGSIISVLVWHDSYRILTVCRLLGFRIAPPVVGRRVNLTALWPLTTKSLRSTYYRDDGTYTSLDENWTVKI